MKQTRLVREVNWPPPTTAAHTRHQRHPDTKMGPVAFTFNHCWDAVTSLVGLAIFARTSSMSRFLTWGDQVLQGDSGSAPGLAEHRDASRGAISASGIDVIRKGHRELLPLIIQSILPNTTSDARRPRWPNW